MTKEKTHYRKAFNSPYLSSADIVEPTTLTISHVALEKDKTKGKNTKEMFNTAFFVEKSIREGEALKPMILNATNSRTLSKLAGSAFIDDWNNIPVSIYVDNKVKMMGEIVDGLRISKEKPRLVKPSFNPDTQLKLAIEAYKRDCNFDAIAKRCTLTESDKELIKNGVQ